MSEDIVRLSATDMVAAFRRHDLSPVEVARALLERIDDRDGAVNAFCRTDPERTLASASESEARYQQDEPLGPVDGVPVAIKDVFLMADWPTLRGSRTVNPDVSLGKDSPAASALRRHGAVALGRTATSELEWKAVTDNPHDGVTNNPHDPEKTAGGSSGGSAASIAAHLAPVALGTDSGGGLRIPASFCGVTGFKPSPGEVPLWPASPFGELASAGPMARTVEDCALLMNVLSEPDPRDSRAVPRRHIDYVAELERGVEGLRIAFSPNLGYVDVVPEVEQALNDAAERFRAMGAEVVRSDPSFNDPLGSFGHLFYGGLANAIRDLSTRKRALMDPELVKVAEKASRITMLGYLGAVNEMTALRERMSAFHQKYDLLLTPTVPITPFRTGREVPEDWPNTRWPTWTPFTYPFNMTGQPAISLPCGVDGEGLPIGMQLVAARFNDPMVLRAAHTWQRASVEDRWQSAESPEVSSV